MSIDQLKVAMLSVHSCPVGKLGTRDTGGMSVCIRELACELGRRGHLVDIYTRLHDPEDRQVYELRNNARLIHLTAGANEEMGKLALYSHLPDFAANVEEFSKQHDLRYDLVFSHYWLSGVAGVSLQQWWRVPHVIMFHTLGAVKNAVRAEAHLMEADDEPELRVRTERSLVQKCHQIIASTQQEREAITKYYCVAPEKISVIPCGVNLEQFRTLDKVQARRHLGIDHDRIALCVGRIDPLKGVDKLIKALPYIRDTGLRMIVIGGGEDSRHEVEQLRKLARTLDVDDSVAFAGPVKHDQLIYYYNAADVCVVPSYYESFGLVALESLACGTPVVATDVGNHRSVIKQGETGYVVKDNAPRRLAEKIALLLAEHGSNTRSASSVRASVSGFSWSNTAEAFVRECQPILGNHSRQLP